MSDIAVEPSLSPERVRTPDESPRKTRRVLVGAVVGFISIVLISAVILREKTGSETSPNPVALASVEPVKVTTVPAVTRELSRYVQTTGSLVAQETSDTMPQISGFVIETPVEAGQFVTKGQTLVRLDDRDARFRLQQAEATLGQAEASLQQMRAELGLKPGQVLDPKTLGPVGAALARKELAEATELRIKALVGTGDVARAQWDEAHSRADVTRHEYNTILAAAMSSRAALDTRTAAVEASRVQVEIARKALADTTIVAPFDGFVADRPATVGEWVTPTTKIATVVQMGTLKLVLKVAETDASRIRLGMPVTLTADAYPDQTFTGKIVYIIPGLDPASRSLEAVVEVANPQRMLRPGMFATAHVIEPSTGETGVMVPIAAVRTTAGSSRVFVIANGLAQARVVQVGQVDGESIQIVSGIAEGERVAVEGLDRLSDGIPVTN